MSTKMVVIVECADGNETVGTTWFTTGIFDEGTDLAVVRDWALQVRRGTGKWILTEPTYEHPENRS